MVRIPVLARIALAIVRVLVVGASPASAAAWPTPVDGTHIVPEFRFADGETMKNGLRGRIREDGDDRFVQLSVSERRMGAHSIYLVFRKGDAAAERIARSLRVAGVSGRC